MENQNPLEYLNREELLLNIMRNIEHKINEDCRVENYDSDGNLDIKFWWANTPNWVKVQTFINNGTSKAGSTSSIRQCNCIGVEPEGKSFYDMKKKRQD